MHRYFWISQFFPCFKVKYIHLYWIFFPEHRNKHVAIASAEMLQLNSFCHFGKKMFASLL